MKKIEILEAARNNGNRENEYEAHENKTASLVSFLATIAVILVLLALELFIKKNINVSLIIVGITAMGTETLYNSKLSKSKWKTALGIICLLLALVMIIAYMVVI